MPITGDLCAYLLYFTKSSALKKILLVDDEPDVLDFLSFNLRHEGFEVILAQNGQDALQIVQGVIPDLIILDLMMPVMDGMEAYSKLRELPELRNSKIIFLTAKQEDISHIQALDNGADDYISKPIKPKLLISRIKSILRRTENSEPENILRFGQLIMNKSQHSVQLDEEDIVLPRKEFSILYLLASKPGRVFSREEIFSQVWGNDVIVGDRSIDVHIRRLREKIGDDFIKTLKGVGYKFESKN